MLEKQDIADIRAHRAVVVSHAKRCDFHFDLPATHDFKTVHGPWANGCDECYHEYRLYLNLGTGMGQRLIVAEDYDE